MGRRLPSPTPWLHTPKRGGFEESTPKKKATKTTSKQTPKTMILAQKWARKNQNKGLKINCQIIPHESTQAGAKHTQKLKWRGKKSASNPKNPDLAPFCPKTRLLSPPPSPGAVFGAKSAVFRRFRPRVLGFFCLFFGFSLRIWGSERHWGRGAPESRRNGQKPGGIWAKNAQK